MTYRAYRGLSGPTPMNGMRRHGDAVLGTFAIGATLLILAWVITGVDLFAIAALLIVLGYFRLAGTLRPSEAAEPAESAPHTPEPNTHAFKWRTGVDRLPARSRRSAYDGLED